MRIIPFYGFIMNSFRVYHKFMYEYISRFFQVLDLLLAVTVWARINVVKGKDQNAMKAKKNPFYYNIW